MKLAWVFTILGVCVAMLEVVSAKPSNSWRASDPRCRGGMQHTRLGRSVTSNNRRTQQGSGGGQLWRFNGNSGSCEMVYGSPQHDNDVFESHNECDQACLNVYHFS